MDGLNNGLKVDMDGLKNGLNVDTKGFNEGLTKLLQEMLPNGKKVFHETHHENKGNVNHDFK